MSRSGEKDKQLAQRAGDAVSDSHDGLLQGVDSLEAELVAAEADVAAAGAARAVLDDDPPDDYAVIEAANRRVQEASHRVERARDRLAHAASRFERADIQRVHGQFRERVANYLKRLDARRPALVGELWEAHKHVAALVGESDALSQERRALTDEATRLELVDEKEMLGAGHLPEQDWWAAWSWLPAQRVAPRHVLEVDPTKSPPRQEPAEPRPERAVGAGTFTGVRIAAGPAIRINQLLQLTDRSAAQPAKGSDAGPFLVATADIPERATEIDVPLLPAQINVVECTPDRVSRPNGMTIETLIAGLRATGYAIVERR